MGLLRDAVISKNSGRPPIWFMRQAGRYHAHYQKVRQKYSFEDICKNSELAAEVAIGPVEEFGLDAAILFSDIMFVFECVGCEVRFDPGPNILGYDGQISMLTESGGIKDCADRVWDVMEFQARAIVETRSRLSKDKDLIGFVGGFATLYYCFLRSQGGVGSDCDGFVGFCEVFFDLLVNNICLQIESGIEVLAILDTEASMFWEDDVGYVDTIQRLVDAVKFKNPDVSLVYYAKRIDHYARLKNVECFGLDSSSDVVDALRRADGKYAIQGCFDEGLLALSSDECGRCLNEYFRRVADLDGRLLRGWINGVGHGLKPSTREGNVKLFVELAYKYFG